MSLSNLFFPNRYSLNNKALTFLPITTTERDLMTPSTGMEIYNTTAGQLQVYNGSSWVPSGTGVILAGDVTGPAGSNTVAHVNLPTLQANTINNSTDSDLSIHNLEPTKSLYLVSQLDLYLTSLHANGRINMAGTMTNANQPIVYASVSADIPNFCGDGAFYIVPFNTATINVGNNYNTTTGVFTAPVTGNYLISTAVVLTAMQLNGTDQSYVELKLSDGPLLYLNTLIPASATDHLSFNGCVIHRMNSGATVAVSINNDKSGGSGAKTTTLFQRSNISIVLLS